jgi:imidazolonepropionase-like amidohydrolase
MDVLKAVTSQAAECLGVERRTGAIRAARQADLIVIRESPLDNAGAIEGVLIVVNDGRVVKNKL